MARKTKHEIMKEFHALLDNEYKPLHDEMLQLIEQKKLRGGAWRVYAWHNTYGYKQLMDVHYSYKRRQNKVWSYHYWLNDVKEYMEKLRQLIADVHSGEYERHIAKKYGERVDGTKIEEA